MSLGADGPWREQLELGQIPQGYWPDVYALGTQASRITFADQQKRALNLVAALVASSRLKPGEHLGIVGGGVAGVTAAAFAGQLGLMPTIVEQHGAAMMIQQGSNRWLHPNLYDWPWPNWKSSSTRFPCMNWSAGSAVAVIGSLRREWRQLEQAGTVTWCGGTPVKSLRRESDAWMVEDGSGGRRGPFKVIVLAVGFGEEDHHAVLDCKPYWRDDDLHQRVRSAAKILVSGCGDGGLIDAIRCLSIDFQHATLAAIAEVADTSEIREYLTRVEADRPRYPDGKKLTEAYLSLDAPEVDRLLSASTNSNTVVTLNSRDDAPLSRSSSILNRFLISRLMRIGTVKHLSGDLDLKSIARSGSTVEVLVGGVQHSFNEVVIRHGPRPAAIRTFSDIADALALAKRFFAAYPHAVDHTRQRLWDSILPSASAASVKATASPSNTVDQRLAEYVGERSQELLKSELQRLVTAPIVSRLTAPNGIDLTVQIGSDVTGSVSLAFASATDVDIKVSKGRRAIHTEAARFSAGEEMMNDVGRVLRTAAFLLGGGD